MAKPKPNTIKPVLPKKDERPVDIYFNRLNASHAVDFGRGSTNSGVLLLFSISFMVFGVLGLSWAIPFPQIKFLNAYNGYFNWASFVIAFWIYYTLRMSPILSYLFLFLMFGFTYGISKLAEWEHTGGQPLWLVSLIIFVFAWLGQYIYGEVQDRKGSFKEDVHLVLITPIWMLHKVLSRFGMKKY